MKKLLQNISLKTNLTKIEISTLFFVIIVFIIGWVAKEVKINNSYVPLKKYTYNFQDSLFKAVKLNHQKEVLSLKKNEKRVDSEVELSDFSSKKLLTKKKSSIQPKGNSININTADTKIFIRLPGIGEKIAKRIVILRNKKGNFKSLDELKEVKGIGSKKFNTIKKFIYLEK